MTEQTDPTPAAALSAPPRWWVRGNERSAQVVLAQRQGSGLRPVAVMRAKDGAQRLADADALSRALNAHDVLVAALEAVEDDAAALGYPFVVSEATVEQVRAALKVAKGAEA